MFFFAATKQTPHVNNVSHESILSCQQKEREELKIAIQEVKFYVVTTDKTYYSLGN